jgi:hypothetical protein
MHTLGIPMVHLSTTVDFVSTSPPDKRIRKLLDHGRTTLAAVTKYKMRPDAVREGMTLYTFYKDHVLKIPSAKASDGEELVGPSVNSEGHGGNNLYKKSPTSDHIVRFTDAHPVHQTETFFYNYLLQQNSFDKEEELFSPDNPYGSYYTEVIMRGHIRDEDSLIDVLSNYTKRHLLSKAKFAAQPEKLIILRDPCDPVIRLLPGETRKPPPKQKTQVDNSVLLEEFAWTQDVTKFQLSDPQRAVVDAILSNPVGMHVIGGKSDAHACSCPLLLSDAPSSHNTLLPTP